MTIPWWYWAVAGTLFLGDAYACGTSGHRWRPLPAALLCLIWPVMAACVAVYLLKGRRDD